MILLLSFLNKNPITFGFKQLHLNFRIFNIKKFPKEIPIFRSEVKLNKILKNKELLIKKIKF